jgi:hypothetical protein
MTDAEYWEILSDLYSSAEFFTPDFEVWENLLFSTRPISGAVKMMRPVDRRALANLPPRFTVYRGQQSAEHGPGFSWTIDRARAHWFAHTRGAERMALLAAGTWSKGAGVVLRGVVSKTDVLCYLSGRGEDEIIVHPSRIANLRSSA